MATVIGQVAGFDKAEDESWDSFSVRTDKLMDELHTYSDSLPDGQVLGGIIRFPFADGQAIYRVKGEKTLKLEHIPFGDAWQADPITIRGLKLSDVVLMLKRSKEISKLFKPLDAIKDAKAKLESHEITPFETLYTREDGQVFGISHTGFGEFQSVVPSDLAAAGEGHQHKLRAGAKSYLWELFYKEVDVEKRFKNALENAKHAFWAEIANSFREIETGDLGPDIVIPLELLMEQAVATWLTGNTHEGNEVNLVPTEFVPLP